MIDCIRLGHAVFVSLGRDQMVSVLTTEVRQEFRIIRMQSNGYSLVEMCECCMLQLADTDSGCGCVDRDVPCVAAVARAQFYPANRFQVATDGVRAGYSRSSCELCNDQDGGDRFEGWVKEIK